MYAGAKRANAQRTGMTISDSAKEMKSAMPSFPSSLQTIMWT